MTQSAFRVAERHASVAVGAESHAGVTLGKAGVTLGKGCRAS